MCGMRRFRRSAVSRTGCSNEKLRYHVRFHKLTTGLHMFLQTQLTQDLSVFLLCLVVLWLVVGPPTASRRNGPSVSWVSLPGPTGVLRCPGRMASEAERQTLLFWLVLLFVSTSLGGPNKVNVIEPFCSCTCCWNRSRFTCVEGSDINWLSFMSLTIATENTYTLLNWKRLFKALSCHHHFSVVSVRTFSS